MLDASSTLSLACLEILVHVKKPRFPFDYRLVKIEIPAGLMDRPFPLPDSDARSTDARSSEDEDFSAIIPTERIS